MAVLHALAVLLVISVLTTGIQAVVVGGWTGSGGPGSSVSHRINGTLTFPNPNTVLVENFNYDGGGLTVFLYFYRPGRNQFGRGGTVIRFDGSQSNGAFVKRNYGGETLKGTMPSGTTVCDIQTLTVWCDPANAIFAQVRVDSSQVFINSGQGECRLVGGDTDLPEIEPVEFDNCFPFSDSLQVSWTVDSANDEIDFQMCSCRATDSVLNQYMGFGLSSRTDQTFMIGADVTVAWLDNAVGTPNAVDYYLTERVQCRGGVGACPDTLVGGQSCTNDIRADSIRGGIRESVQQCVAFSRPITTSDSGCDINFDLSNQRQFIVWAIGGLGETAFIHFDRANPDSSPINLNRTAQDQCTTPISCASCPPFQGKQMMIPGNTILRVTIGPSAQERGYMAITGQAGWGISWFVNDTLIPELVVQRGSRYTFIIEGGSDSGNLARYHPFYISDSPSGGRIRNTPEQRNNETVYAGFDPSDQPTGVGRLCERQESAAAQNIRETCGDQDRYFSELTSQRLVCDSGSPGTFTWIPDENTPDIVYYQCATHQNLGWKIIVNGDMATISAISIFSVLLLVLLSFLFM